MMIFNNYRDFIGSMILLCLGTFALNAQAESNFIDKVKSVSTQGIAITEIKDYDKKVMIVGNAKDNKIISKYMRVLDSEIGSPNLEYIKKNKQGGGAMSNFAISIKKPKK